MFATDERCCNAAAAADVDSTLQFRMVNAALVFAMAPYIAIQRTACYGDMRFVNEGGKNVQTLFCMDSNRQPIKNLFVKRNVGVVAAAGHNRSYFKLDREQLERVALIDYTPSEVQKLSGIKRDILHRRTLPLFSAGTEVVKRLLLKRSNIANKFETTSLLARLMVDENDERKKCFTSIKSEAITGALATFAQMSGVGSKDNDSQKRFVVTNLRRQLGNVVTHQIASDASLLAAQQVANASLNDQVAQLSFAMDHTQSIHNNWYVFESVAVTVIYQYNQELPLLHC